ncbi:phage protein NinX family protein [Yersinia intermedia]|uniref:phage protein NinX family protein n=1 Tax=Yersinia intermedia TaxID=631 RepID=UPI0039C7117E
MKDYSAMSDFEINKAVAIHLGMKPFDAETGWQGLTKEPYVDVVVRGAGRLGAFNPCNKPADAWPIIKKAEISILKDNGLHLWCATSSAYWADGAEWQIGGDVMDANPLRAAMIVFLMMKDRENNHD